MSMTFLLSVNSFSILVKNLVIIVSKICCKLYGDLSTIAGFISIDCGATSSYVDQTTGLVWNTDTNYTSGGQNDATVPGALAYSASFSTLRYFPKPQKYCYELPGTTPNASYMIRHSYWYGNYDGLAKPPSFNVALDASLAANINVSGLSLPYVMEHFYKARKNSITFCLYRDATNSTPFISSLELRPLQTGAYEQKTLTDGNALLAPFRLNYGGNINKKIRYNYVNSCVNYIEQCVCFLIR